MVLSPHIIVGASLANLLTFNPLIAFFIGFISHFLLDAIPHWDYEIKFINNNEDKLKKELNLNKNFKIDLLKIGLDFLLGLIVLSFFIDGQNLYILLFGALGGIFPDLLQVLYYKFKVEPLKSLQKFHVVFIHSDLFKFKIIPGILTQIFVVIISIFLLLI